MDHSDVTADHVDAILDELKKTGPSGSLLNAIREIAKQTLQGKGAYGPMQALLTTIYNIASPEEVRETLASVMFPLGVALQEDREGAIVDTAVAAMVLHHKLTVVAPHECKLSNDAFMTAVQKKFEEITSDPEFVREREESIRTHAESQALRTFARTDAERHATTFDPNKCDGCSTYEDCKAMLEEVRKRRAEAS